MPPPLSAGVTLMSAPSRDISSGVIPATSHTVSKGVSEKGWQWGMATGEDAEKEDVKREARTKSSRKSSLSE